MFLSYFGNVAMLGKDAAEKLIELFAHLDVEAFQLFFERVIENGKLNDAAIDFEKVKVVYLLSTLPFTLIIYQDALR